MVHVSLSQYITVYRYWQVTLGYYLYV